MTSSDLYERLVAAASLDGPDAAIRIHADYEPVGGEMDKVYPPTYFFPPSSPDGPYLEEERFDAEGVLQKVVLLDSRQAQANRCEEALLRAVDEGLIELPHLRLEVTTHDRALIITSLQAPHRSRDAYFRDAQDEKDVAFDQTTAGEALAAVTPDAAAALYRHSPADLVYGVWDSHRDLRLAARFPRVYTSEVAAFGAEVGKRAAGRFDLLVSGKRTVKGGAVDWEPVDGRPQVMLSAVGHGPIPPTVSVGGVHARQIRRSASIGFAGLARVNLGAAVDVTGQRAARAVLAVLALLGDRLAFGRPAVFLRSGCELVLRKDGEQLEWVGRQGTEPLTLDVTAARELFEHSVEQAVRAGVDWMAEPLLLRPQPKLQQVIDDSFLAAPDEDE